MLRFTPLAALVLLVVTALPAAAQEQNPPVGDTVTFVVSTGFWQEPAEEAGTNADKQAKRGYYKLIAERQEDGTAKIYLQQIEATAQGPKITSSTELEAFTAMKPYVTDIRPENSSGITTQPGLFATVHLKTDPKETEPESWTVLIDDLGDMRIERATN